ncbi:hypothetical protein PR048_029413 [Dryococelus australis]|uniref:Non-specific serine/threonine protein kinase n=1 Tax=Dryococelus australis TaxID=614101 RepID=A0ABQ9GDY8_9NEOP|nr:hypothetical protein PR048_029413 [Dryococelus australis]
MAVYTRLFTRSLAKCLQIKQVPVDSDLQEIIKEISIMQQCHSPWIVKYYGSYFHNTDLWIVMEYCGAGSVSDIMRLCQKTLVEEEIATILCDALKGLEYLHLRRKIHRDIKAGNILLNTEGHAKLADFGVAGQLTDTMAQRNTMIGTPFWMAPEVIQEIGYDCAVDIWSLGITSLEMAEGKPPYGDIHPMRAIFMIPTKPPPSFRQPDKWSPEFIDFVSSCLVKSPEERATASELLQHDFIGNAKPPSILHHMIQEAQKIREDQAQWGGGRRNNLLQFSRQGQGITLYRRPEVSSVSFTRFFRPHCLEWVVRTRTKHPPRMVVDEVDTLFQHLARMCSACWMSGRTVVGHIGNTCDEVLLSRASAQVITGKLKYMVELVEVSSVKELGLMAINEDLKAQVGQIQAASAGSLKTGPELKTVAPFILHLSNCPMLIGWRLEGEEWSLSGGLQQDAVDWSYMGKVSGILQALTCFPISQSLLSTSFLRRDEISLTPSRERASISSPPECASKCTAPRAAPHFIRRLTLLQHQLSEVKVAQSPKSDDSDPGTMVELASNLHTMVINSYKEDSTLKSEQTETKASPHRYQPLFLMDRKQIENAQVLSALVSDSPASNRSSDTECAATLEDSPPQVVQSKDQQYHKMVFDGRFEFESHLQLAVQASETTSVAESEAGDRELEEFDEAYYRIQEVFNKLVVIKEVGREQQCHLGQASSNVLPKLQLPTFKGLLTDWPTFYDLFTSLVHNKALAAASLTDTIRKFWESKEVPSVQHCSPEDIECESHFVETHSRDPEDVYVMRPPFKEKEPELEDSHSFTVKRASGKLLNCVLLTRPKLQNDIVDIITHFHLHPVVMTTDFCKMYQQVHVHLEDASYQIILWRESPDQSVHRFQLDTVTLVCQQLLSWVQYQLQKPSKLQQELINLLKQGGFELRKWSSNSQAVLDAVPENHRESPLSFQGNSEVIKAFICQLDILSKLSIPRIVSAPQSEYQLRVFSDATNESYAAVVYLHTAHQGGVKTHLLLAKSRVPPLKTVTLPRLELQAAHLLMELLESVMSTLSGSIHISCITAWCDSTVGSLPGSGFHFIWRHVPSADYAADCASRGLSPQDLLTHTLWWTGPSWLISEKESWPCGGVATSIHEGEEELKQPKVVSLVGHCEPNLLASLSRFSSWSQLQRVLAYVLRFISNLKVLLGCRRNGPLTLVELDAAKKMCPKQVQRECFSSESECLISEGECPSGTGIRKLNPFLDCDDILRVDARSYFNDLQNFLSESANLQCVADTLATRGIQWNLNPPSAPHFGQQVLTLEELSTLFAQIEAIFNSRPLCTISSDRDDLEALTPAHFLVGTTLTAPPVPDLTEIQSNRLGGGSWYSVTLSTSGRDGTRSTCIHYNHVESGPRVKVRCRLATLSLSRNTTCHPCSGSLDLKFLNYEELRQRMENLDSEMEQEILALRRRYQKKHQPILNAMDQKRKRQQNF